MGPISRDSYEGCTDSVRKRFSPGPGPHTPASCRLPSLGLISVSARGGTWGFLFTVQFPATRSPAVLTLGRGCGAMGSRCGRAGGKEDKET